MVLSRLTEYFSGYEYDPDSTHSPTWVDSDFYTSIEDGPHVTNSAPYFFGLTGSITQVVEGKAGYTIGVLMSEVAEGAVEELREVREASKFT